MNRNRIFYLVLIVVTIGAGLISRHNASSLSHWLNLYLGDVLWALMVFFIMGFIFKKTDSLWVALLALMFSFGIEISQLYHAPWIEYLRAYRLGGLILGYGFLWSDLVCYTVGVGFGLLLEKYIIKTN